MYKFDTAFIRDGQINGVKNDARAGGYEFSLIFDFFKIDKEEICEKYRFTVNSPQQILLWKLFQILILIQFSTQLKRNKC